VFRVPLPQWFAADGLAEKSLSRKSLANWLLLVEHGHWRPKIFQKCPSQMCIVLGMKTNLNEQIMNQQSNKDTKTPSGWKLMLAWIAIALIYWNRTYEIRLFIADNWAIVAFVAAAIAIAWSQLTLVAPVLGYRLTSASSIGALLQSDDGGRPMRMAYDMCKIENL
jgi:hypothetical protein